MGLFEDLFNIFVKPIVDAVVNAGAPYLEKITGIDITKLLADGKAIAYSAVTDMEAKMQEAYPMTPEGAVSLIADARLVQRDKWYEAYTTNLIIEGMSLGQVDSGPAELFNEPQFKASLQLATTWWAMPYTLGVTPLAARFFNKAWTPLLPETYRLALAVTKGVIDDAKYLTAMAESGLNEDWAGVWREENYVYPNPEQAFELLWRGVIDEVTLNLILVRNGFRADMAEYVKALRYLIPPASDLITMVVREAFDPAFVTAAPDIFAEYMVKKGYSTEWADRYWTAHWVPIPLSQAYANLHRGYWDKERFMTALRIADLHPEWREDIYNVAFNPPSIREMGYGYDVGAYTIEDIIRYRRWGGLSAEDAEKAGVSMVAYRTEAERNAVRTEYMYLYGRGKISLREFESKLTELGTPAPAVALWMERAEAYKIRITTEPTPEEPPSMTRSTAQWLFENGIRTETWLRDTLAALGYPADTVEDFVAQSKHKIAEAEAKAGAVEYRKLTLTQIRDLYKLGYIEYDKVPAELVKIGYEQADAEKLAELMIYEVAMKLEPTRLSRTDIVRLYEYKLLGLDYNKIIEILQNIFRAETPYSPTQRLFEMFQELGYDIDDAAALTLWTVIDMAIPMLKAQYSKGWITATQMYNQLVAIGLPQDRANELMTTIVKAEAGERTVTERDLTKAEIIKGVKQEILTPSQAAELLQGIGYDEDEAWYLLYINAVVARGDPEGYWEMRKVVEQQKKARGEPYKDIPDDLIMLELRLKEAKAELERLKREKASEEAIGAQAVTIAGLETNMRVVVAKLKI